MKIPESEIQAAREKFIGKKVIIKNATGKTTQHKNKDVGGLLSFLGYIEHFPSWGLCATVGGMPVQHIKLEDISLIDV
jgi:hypothetical protein